jgi:hypothetical protein
MADTDDFLDSLNQGSHAQFSGRFPPRKVAKPNSIVPVVFISVASFIVLGAIIVAAMRSFEPENKPRLNAPPAPINTSEADARALARVSRLRINLASLRLSQEDKASVLESIKSEPISRDLFSIIAEGADAKAMKAMFGIPESTQSGSSDLWYYRGASYDPVTGKTDWTAQVVFESGRVVRVNFN